MPQYMFLVAVVLALTFEGSLTPQIAPNKALKGAIRRADFYRACNGSSLNQTCIGAHAESRLLVGPELKSSTYDAIELPSDYHQPLSQSY